MKLESKYNLGDTVIYTTWNRKRIGIITRVEAYAYYDANILIYGSCYCIRYGNDPTEKDTDIQESSIQGIVGSQELNS